MTAPNKREKDKNTLKEWAHIKLYSGLPFPEHNNLFRINFSRINYFQFWIFFYPEWDFDFLFPDFYI